MDAASSTEASNTVTIGTHIEPSEISGNAGEVSVMGRTPYESTSNSLVLTLRTKRGRDIDDYDTPSGASLKGTKHLEDILALKSSGPLDESASSSMASKKDDGTCHSDEGASRGTTSEVHLAQSEVEVSVVSKEYPILDGELVYYSIRESYFIDVAGIKPKAHSELAIWSAALIIFEGDTLELLACLSMDKQGTRAVFASKVFVDKAQVKQAGELVLQLKNGSCEGSNLKGLKKLGIRNSGSSEHLAVVKLQICLAKEYTAGREVKLVLYCTDMKAAGERQWVDLALQSLAKIEKTARPSGSSSG